jgi:hypothetical protein
MECQICCSGYQINSGGDERYCGFCGAPLQSLEVEIQESDGPYYIDDSGPIRLKIRLKNVGMVDVKLDGIEFS